MRNTSRGSGESNSHLHFLLGLVMRNETTISVYFTSLAWNHSAMVGSLGDVDRVTIWFPPTFDGCHTRAEAVGVDLAGARHPSDSARVTDENLVSANLQDRFHDMNRQLVLGTPTWISSFLNPITAPFWKILEAFPTTGQGTRQRVFS